MDDALLHERDEPIDYIFEYFDGFVFWEGSIGSDEAFKVVLAELLDDVVIVGTLHHLVNRHYVGRFHLLQDLDLLQQSSLQILIRVYYMRSHVLSLRLTTLTAQAFLVFSCSPL